MYKTLTFDACAVDVFCKEILPYTVTVSLYGKKKKEKCTG